MDVHTTVLDWLATGATAGGTFLSLLTHDLLQRAAILAGPHAHQRTVSSMARWIDRSARLSGARFAPRGLENVDWSRNYIVVMNHQSMLDIAMASEFLERLEPRYVSKRELAHGIPGVSFNLRRGGSVLIDRRDPAQSHTAIEEAARRVREEHLTIVIFPEGTRSKTGEMKPFKVGGLRTLVAGAPGVPVLPVTSYGGSRMFHRGYAPLARNVELGFVVHPPVRPPEPAREEAFSAFVRQIERTIASALPV